MKTVALIDADLEKTPLGTRSRLADPLEGVPVLRRTVRQLAQVSRLSGITVVGPPDQVDSIAALLAQTPARVRPRNIAEPGFRKLVRTARKWSLDGWRGGLGGSTALDEYIDPELCRQVGQAESADAVAVAPPGAALLDPHLTDALLTHAEQHEAESKLTFAQAPPGILPTVLRQELSAQLADHRVPPGWALAYKPDDPSIDLVFRTCNFPIGAAVRYAAGRLTADTARSFRDMELMLAHGTAHDADDMGRWLQEARANDCGDLPREVEIELTTADPLPETRLRPRGARVPQRGPIGVDVVARLAATLAERDDDALVVLGGFGDPLLHPEFEAVLAALRSGGVYGISVTTTGQRLDDKALAALIRHRVDVVVFQLDAHTPDCYRAVNGGALEVATDALARLSQARADAQQAEPIIVPQMTKSTRNVEEMDVFFDTWMRAQGWATIAGFSHFGGRLDDLTVVGMAPPRRRPCRRIMHRCVVLTDGTVTACDQDYAGDLPLGKLTEQSLGEIWTGSAARLLRKRHFDDQPQLAGLCGACEEWHRP
jgi:spiro-SPASM protein